MTDDHTLTLAVRGSARFETTTETESLGAVTQSDTRDVVVDVEIDADRLYHGDIADVHRAGVTLSVSDVADLVRDDLDAEPVATDGWELTVSASLDDWQKVLLEAAEERRQFESDQVDTAIDGLLSLHERHAQTDRPIYAALNVDETYGGGRREELLSRLVDEGPDAEAAPDVEEVA